jgi:hypothetical protein
MLSNAYQRLTREPLALEYELTSTFGPSDRDAPT